MTPNNGTTNGTLAPIVSGGAALALDTTNVKDQALVRECIRKWPGRWRGVSDEIKNEVVEGMREANKTARQHLKAADPEVALKAVAAIGSIGRTFVAMEGQNQADDHASEKHAIVGSGGVTDRKQVVHEYVVTFDRNG